MKKFKEYWFQILMALITFAVLAYVAIHDSKRDSNVIHISSNEWQCVERKASLILLNGQPRNTTKCVNYVRN